MLKEARQPLRQLALALLLLGTKAPLAAADRVLKVPFEYATNGNSILLRASINEKPVLLILDTTSAQTILRTNSLGLSRAEVESTSVTSSGSFFAEVTIELGKYRFEKRRVAILDLAEKLSAYKENIDGLLGLDFLQEFSQVIVNVKRRTITLIADEEGLDSNASIGLNKGNGRFGGYLQALSLYSTHSSFTINGIDLPEISGNAIDLSSSDHRFQVRISLLNTVLVAGGFPAKSSDGELLRSFAVSIPVVAKILSDRDPIGSFKPLIYDLIAPQRSGLELQERVTLLFSADPDDQPRVDKIVIPPPVPFSSPVADVQYRGLRNAGTDLFAKAYLQLVYISEGQEHALLGAFVIVSTSDGQYQFYAVPRDVLSLIVADNHFNSRSEPAERLSK